MAWQSVNSHQQRLEAMRRPALVCGILSMLFAPGLALAAAAAATSGASPAEARFETSFLSSENQVDMSRFEKGNVILPDTYRVDIIVNQNWLGREDIVFKDRPGSNSAVPCLPTTILSKWGVDLDKVARGDGTRTEADVKAHSITAPELCGDIGQYIPDASLTFDPGAQTLTVTVPQLYMDNHARGYVDPSKWDKGVDAGLITYNFAASHTAGRINTTQSYLGLNAGINLGDWHVRHQGALQWSSGGGTHYQNTASYVQRDIPALKSQLTLGDSFTSGQVTDSFRVRGVNVSSDPRMYPQSQQGYAPVVRGIAESNARVSIRQNGYVIYETTVAPGPFEISDLYATGYGGDLEVTVTESDGRKNVFLVPFTAVPQLLRPGQTQFSAVAGQLEQYGTRGSTPWVVQTTVQHGISNAFTGFGSFTASQGYGQINGGTAFNTRYGALAASLAISQTQLPGGPSMHGQSLGLTYSKNVTHTGTNLAMGAYRYSTSGYLGLLDAVNMRQLVREGLGTANYARQRNRLDLNISQTVGSEGSLYLAGSTTDYWGNGAGRQTSYSAGYSSHFGPVSWNLSVSRTRTQAATYRNPTQDQIDAVNDIFYGPGYVTPGYVAPGTTDNRIMLTLSMPLGSSPKAPTLNTYLTRNTGSSTSTNAQVGVSGSAGRDNQITYGVSANRNFDQSGSDYFNTNVGYQSSVAEVRGGYSRSGDTNQVSVSGDGGVLIHEGGVQFAQQLGDTVALIEAPGAEGASVSNAVGVHVGSNGYAVVPSLMPYQLNTISIDPKGMSDDTELKDTSVTVAPHFGAVVKVKYETESGRAVIMKAMRANGEPLPFAADVLDEQGKSVGVVGQASKLFLRGIADQGRLLVKWGDAPESQCHIAYSLPPQAKGAAKQSATVVQARCEADGVTASSDAVSAGAGEGVGQ
jgi:outer membrane usher protein